VFVVASARKGFDPAAVLLEFEGLRRDTPPRRETWKDATARSAPGADERRSHWDGVEHPHPTLNQSFNTGAIGYSNQELFSQRGAGLVGEASTGDVSHCLNAGGMGRQDYETETLVTHALRGEGFDGSEDGTGRGTPLVPVAFSAKDHGADATEDLSPTLRAMPHDGSHANGGGQMAVALPLLEVGKRTGPSSTDDMRAGLGIGEDGDPMYTLQAGAQHGVAAYAFQPRIARNGRGDMGDVVNALTMSGETGKGDTAPCVAIADTLGVGSNQTSGFESEVVAASLAVRRLLPEECESLQGFQRGYTRIPWKKKPAEDCPDGPRYRALGNSMAVNVMRWIGERIKAMVAQGHYGADT
jgi:DNA (cytosine-5)-methyltransferase 1